MSGQNPLSSPYIGADAAPTIEPLTTETVGRLRIKPFGRFSVKWLRSNLDGYSDLSLMVKGTGEFVVASSWRNRDDIFEVLDLSNGQNSIRLLDELSLRFSGRGGQLVVLDFDLFSTNKPVFRQAGFTFLEEIIEMASTGVEPNDHRPDYSVSVQPERDPALLLSIDHEAFPWLWRNSAREMTKYLSQAGVRAFVAKAGGHPAGYISYTLHRDSTYVDRIAVQADRQGQGIGKALMGWSLGKIKEAGIGNVTLTTQRTNLRSQQLYQRFGFAETRWGYSIYGKWLTKHPADV